MDLNLPRSARPVVYSHNMGYAARYVKSTQSLSELVAAGIFRGSVREIVRTTTVYFVCRFEDDILRNFTKFHPISSNFIHLNPIMMKPKSYYVLTLLILRKRGWSI